MLLTYGKHLHNRLITPRGEIWVYRNSLNRHFLCTYSKSEKCAVNQMYVRGIEFACASTIFRWDIGNVLKVLYVLFTKPNLTLIFYALSNNILIHVCWSCIFDNGLSILHCPANLFDPRPGQILISISIFLFGIVKISIFNIHMQNYIIMFSQCFNKKKFTWILVIDVI